MTLVDWLTMKICATAHCQQCYDAACHKQPIGTRIRRRLTYLHGCSGRASLQLPFTWLLGDYDNEFTRPPISRTRSGVKGTQDSAPRCLFSKHLVCDVYTVCTIDATRRLRHKQQLWPMLRTAVVSVLYIDERWMLMITVFTTDRWTLIAAK